jgi:CRP/FNR family transcriptional regulator, anaerobic regulatory protein
MTEPARSPAADKRRDCCNADVSPVTKDEILQMFGFYTGAAESGRHVISEAAVAVQLAEGALFYREGDVCREVGLVGRGDIRVFKTASSGRDVTLYHVRDRQPCLINMLAAFLGRGAMASAGVEAPTEAVLFRVDVFRNLLTTSDALQKFVFETMAARLVEVMTLVEEITVRRMDTRLASWLLRRFAAQRPNDTIALTHDEVASELGTVREVVSRLLKEFERKGAIRLSRGRILLANAHVLSELLPKTDAR